MVAARYHKKKDKAAWQDLEQRLLFSQGMLATVHLDACSMATKGEENGGDHFELTMELWKQAYLYLVAISNDIKKAKMVELAQEKDSPCH